ncbi:hypothetical protein BH24DEI2_BH24DEI2_26300 [soil metagenome]
MLNLKRRGEGESRVRLWNALSAANRRGAVQGVAHGAATGEATGTQAEAEWQSEYRRCLGRHGSHLLGVPAVSVVKLEVTALKEPVSP